MLQAPGFAAAVLGVSVAVVLLSRATQRALTPDPGGGAWLGEDLHVSTADLYLNVVITQLVVVAAIGAIVWLTTVPRDALGPAVNGWHVVGGIALGVVLYLANAASVRLLDRLAVSYSEDLRGALAPASPAGWVILLVVVLPVIAAAEELLFRAALIGGLAAGLGVSPWALIVVSAALFAIGHGIQGAGGVVVTGALGVVLGVAFVATSSLLFVVVAHYVVNVLEFVIHEGIGIDSATTRRAPAD